MLNTSLLFPLIPLTNSTLISPYAFSFEHSQSHQRVEWSMNSLEFFLSLLPVGSMGLGHMPPYMTSFLIQVKHALLLLSLETVCSTPGVHLHNCKVYFVKYTVKRLLSLPLQLTGGSVHTTSVTVVWDVDGPMSWAKSLVSTLDAVSFRGTGT